MKQVLLGYSNAKTIKGEKIIDIASGLPYKTAILYMSPFTHNSKGINVCSHASKGCAESCLVSSGLGGIYPKVNEARMKKTEYFLKDRIGFMYQIKEEIEKALIKFEGKFKLVVRLNGTSDLPFEKYRIFEGGKNIFEVFSGVTFYDYTKNHLRFEKVLPNNYSLTFSRSETNHIKAIELLTRGFNVAMVMTQLVSSYRGFEVINGDESDLRFLDKKGVIVGLRYKKMTNKGADNLKAIKSGFVINTTSTNEAMQKYNALITRIKMNLEKFEFA